MGAQLQLTLWSAVLFILFGGVSSFFVVKGVSWLALDQTTVDSTMAAVGSKTTYTGATTTTFGWALSSEFGIAVGVLIGVLGFLLNWYYSRKRDQREQAAHDVLMRLHANTEDEPEAKIRQIMKRQWDSHD